MDFVASRSETTPDPRPLSCRTHLYGHMFFAKEFLCSHTLNFTVHLELEWLLLRNFFPDCTIFKNAGNQTHEIWSSLTKTDWTEFSFSPLCSLVYFSACRDACRDPHKRKNHIWGPWFQVVRIYAHHGRKHNGRQAGRRGTGTEAEGSYLSPHVGGRKC